MWNERHVVLLRVHVSGEFQVCLNRFSRLSKHRSIHTSSHFSRLLRNRSIYTRLHILSRLSRNHSIHRRLHIFFWLSKHVNFWAFEKICEDSWIERFLTLKIEWNQASEFVCISWEDTYLRLSSRNPRALTRSSYFWQWMYSHVDECVQTSWWICIAGIRWMCATRTGRAMNVYVVTLTRSRVHPWKM